MSERPPGWYAVSLSGDVPAGTSTGTRLLGEEIVVWRDATGVAHAWEDRCPHRGMRLSMGFVRAERIACLYHGWQYGTDGHCLYIPAHPDIQVPASIVTWRHSCREAMGLIWVHFGEVAPGPPLPADAEDRDLVPVRSVYVDGAADLVAVRFAAAEPPPFHANPETLTCSSRYEGRCIIHTLDDGVIVETLIGAVQPIDINRSALHLLVVGNAGSYRGAGQIHFSRFAEGLRDSIESRVPVSAAGPVPAFA